MALDFQSRQHSFAAVPRVTRPRSVFDRSCKVLTTFDAGWLVPIFCDEVVPGDSFSMSLDSFVRTATLLKPVLDNMYAETFFFFVPLRLLQDNFVKMMGQQDNPGDSISYIAPRMTAPSGGYTELSLSDYFGIPTKVDSLVHHSYFHRAYSLIWNTKFRDQNLQNSAPFNRGDGPDNPNDFVLRRRGKRHDYFTSCLPWPQKGATVTIPLGTSAPVTGYVNGPTVDIINNVQFQEQSFGTHSTLGFDVSSGGPGYTELGYVRSGGPSFGDPLLSYMLANTVSSVTSPGSMVADLSSATAATVNALRQAFQLQVLLERDARSGTRYPEVVSAHFGVDSPDARLQLPEYLGGGSSRVNVHPVTQTSESTTTSAQANLSAFGTLSVGGGFSRSFTEHGVILGLVSVRSDMTYQQGLNRMFTRSSRYDFMWPEFANLGEQAVLNQEIYADGSSNDSLTFGYQERYAEYRYKPSLVTGLFRSNASASLDVWHLSQEFGSLPVLGDTFIQENPPMARVSAVPSEPMFIGDFSFHLKCTRELPVYSVPGLIDHF